MGHRGQSQQDVIAKPREKARRTVIRDGTRLRAGRRNPVHEPGGQVVIGGRVRDLQPGVVLVAVGAHTQIAQHRVGSATGQQRGFPVPQRDQQTAAAREGARESHVACVPQRDARGGRALLGRCAQRDGEAADCGVRQQPLEQRERVKIEVCRVLLQPHGQHGIHAKPKLEGGLHYQQVGAGRHARHDPHLGVWQALFELLQDLPERLAQVWQCVRVQVPVPGNADDERRNSVVGVVGQVLRHRRIVRPAEVADNALADNRQRPLSQARGDWIRLPRSISLRTV